MSVFPCSRACWKAIAGQADPGRAGSRGADYGFREAVATRDTDTLVSVLENSGKRIGAAMIVLTSLNGEVIAASGLHVKAGTRFPLSSEQRSMAGDNATSLMVDNGRIYQLVTVSVRSPLPVAWIAMGFELDDKAARELADITGLAVTLSGEFLRSLVGRGQHHRGRRGAPVRRRHPPHRNVQVGKCRGRRRFCRGLWPTHARRSST